MIRILAIAASAVFVASSAMAATTAATPAAAVTCSKATPDKFKPQAELIALLKTKGLTVSKIKVENGCYETYAKDAAGKKANAAYNAETFEMLDNAEGGEAVKPKQ
jgi:hypothetical protein